MNTLTFYISSNTFIRFILL